jgi:hypothetical protein
MPLRTHFVGLVVGDVLPEEGDVAAGDVVDAGDEVEDGGLSRAVGADEPAELSLLKDEAHVVHGVDAAEEFVDAAEFEGEGHGATSSPARGLFFRRVSGRVSGRIRTAP